MTTFDEHLVLPSELTSFLGRATVAIAGTRDANLVPHVHRASGWFVSEGGSSITCLFAEVFTRHLISCLEDNGQLALTVSEVPSHETYQFKGRYQDARPAEGEDLERAARQRDEFTGKVVPLFGFSEAAARAFHPSPSLAVRFAVREVFDQTPGPSAGRRILPAEG